MIVLGCDLGMKSINALAVRDTESDKVLSYIHTNKKDYKNPYSHRKFIVDIIDELHSDYNIDLLLFEKINLFRGQHISNLSNILSLAFLQCSIIDSFSNDFDIAHIDVRSWKSKVLGSAKSKSEDVIKFVSNRYKEVNLVLDDSKDELIYNEHLADAIAITLYPDKEYIKKNIVNYT